MTRQNRIVTSTYNRTLPSASYVAIGIVMILLSIITAIATYNHYKHIQKVISEGVNVSATCTKTWSETKTSTHKSKYGPRKTTKHTYYYANASYTYGGRTYHCNKLSADSSTKVGDPISIYILPDNPAQYVQSGQQAISFGMIILCLVLFFIGISVLITPISQRQYANRNSNFIPVQNNRLNNNYQNRNFPQNRSNYNPNNTYQGYDNHYNPDNTYQGYDNHYNSNNTYQGYDNRRR